MGSAAGTLSDSSPVSLEEAKALAGASWDCALQSKFEAAADSATGLVDAAAIEAFIAEQPLNVSSGANPINGATTSRWLFIKAVTHVSDLAKISREDLTDTGVRLMLKFIDGTPRLSDQNLDDKIKEATFSDAEREAVRMTRRARIRKEAEEHMARFEAMTEQEREDARNDGDLRK